MSSHAAAASKTIALLLAGGTPAPDMEYRVDGMRSRGTRPSWHTGLPLRQAADRALRAKAMADNPALAVTAQMFSVK
jgi:UDP:flavonoid glycosyltransferase YjiC (YdhE family)